MAVESLIPKKNPSRTVLEIDGFGLLLRISFIVFLVAALFAGGLYLYKNFAKKNLDNQKSVFAKLEVAFEPSLINELERVSNSIKAAREILRSHVKTSAILDLLAANTLPSVSYSNFSYSYEKNSVLLNGEAASYTDVAAQSSVFESLSQVESATFSNLALKDTSSVSFSLNIILKK